MAMVPLHKLFGRSALRETRVLHARGRHDLPDGEYAFVESYCDDPGCDCRRVLISVVSREADGRIFATINYGWEVMSFYEQWLEDDRDAEDCKGPSLEPINPQSAYSSVLLLLFKEMLSDTEYVERFSTHYAMVKRSAA